MSVPVQYKGGLYLDSCSWMFLVVFQGNWTPMLGLSTILKNELTPLSPIVTFCVTLHCRHWMQLAFQEPAARASHPYYQPPET